DVALDVIEVDLALAAVPLLRPRATEGKPGHPQRLLESLTVAKKTRAGFEYAHALLFAVDVGAQNVEQTAEQSRAHDVEIACNRIQHLDGIVVDAQRALPGGA